MSDSVEHPSHYTFGKIEVIDVLTDWFPSNPLLWQVGKYIARAGRKGPPLEDLRKAAWYLNREIKRLESTSCDPRLDTEVRLRKPRNLK